MTIEQQENQVAQYHVQRARSYCRFESTDTPVAGRSCRNCIKWQFSHPWTCSDALPLGSKDGSRCLNWADSMAMVKEQEGRS